MTHRALFVLFLAATPIFSQAESVGNLFFSRDELRVLSKHSASLVRAQAAGAEVSEPSWSLALGAAIDHGEDGDRSWNTPFDLERVSADSKTAFHLEGDGYTHDRAGATTASGLADVTLAGSHDVLDDRDSMIRLGAALVLPTHGDVGSTAAAERLVGAYVRKFDQVAASLQANVTHRGAVGSGSHFGQGVLAQLAWNLSGQVQDVAVQLGRSWRSGGGGATQAAVATDIQITKTLTGSFTLSRGLTHGARDTSAEFDVTFPF